MKKNKFDALWFQLKGYDKVRAIYKLRKSINKFGDKLGKKNILLNNILNKNLIKNNISDLNITRFYPLEKQIYFSNALIKSKHYNPNNNKYLEDIKINDNTEVKSILEQDNKIIVRNRLKIKENNKKSGTLTISSEYKIKNKYFYRKNIENKKINVNNEIESKGNKNKTPLKNKGLVKMPSIFQPIRKSRTYSDFFSASDSYKDFYSNNISPKNKNNDIENFVKDKKKENNNNNQKSNIQNININMSLYKKKIIPKIQILQFRSNQNRIRLQKNFSTSSINNKTYNTSKTRNNFFYKKYKSQSLLNLKKIKLDKIKNISDRSNKNVNSNIIGETINENLINKGINTSKTLTFNFFNRKRIPSYIRLSNINKISFPKADFNLGNRDKINIINNGLIEKYFSILENKNFPTDNICH